MDLTELKNNLITQEKCNGCFWYRLFTCKRPQGPKIGIDTKGNYICIGKVRD